MGCLKVKTNWILLKVLCFSLGSILLALVVISSDLQTISKSLSRGQRGMPLICHFSSPTVCFVKLTLHCFTPTDTWPKLTWRTLRFGWGPALAPPCSPSLASPCTKHYSSSDDRRNRHATTSQSSPINYITHNPSFPHNFPFEKILNRSS